MTRTLLTYCDVFEHLTEFLSGQRKENGDTASSKTKIRRAILDAYTEIVNAHRWSFLQRPGRIVVYPRYTTGTCVYTHTGGTYERELTLTDGTWPSYAADMSIRLGSNNYVCDIEEWKSDSVVTLDATMNPGEDVASTSFVLYHRFVRLPEDFVSFTGPTGETHWRLGREVTAAEFVGLDKYHSSSGDILLYYIGECPDVHDRKALFIWPQMDSQRVVDFVYRRRPRELRYSGYASGDYAGTIAVTAGSAVVTGTSTSFASTMAGSILRIGTSATNRPTGLHGEYPYAEERSIASYSTSTSLTLDAVVQTTRSGVKYTVTDPIDLGRVAHPAFLRECEKQAAILCDLDHYERIERRAEKALLSAMGADNATEWDPLHDTPYPVTMPDGEVSFADE
jgi:hypothetical protein